MMELEFLGALRVFPGCASFYRLTSVDEDLKLIASDSAIVESATRKPAGVPSKAKNRMRSGSWPRGGRSATATPSCCAYRQGIWIGFLDTDWRGTTSSSAMYEDTVIDRYDARSS